MTPSIEDLGARLRGILDDFVKRGAVLGVAAHVQVADRSWTLAAGSVSAEEGAAVSAGTRFRIGCLTKLAVALAAQELADRGELDLDAELGGYVHELAIPPFQGVTMRHLLSHTAGYVPENVLNPDVRFDFTWPLFLESLNASQRLFAAGKVFNYIHSGYVVAGRVLAQMTGKTVSRLIADVAGLDIDALSPEDIAPGHTYRMREKEFASVEPVELAPFWEDSLQGPPLNITELAQLGERLLRLVSRQREQRESVGAPMMLPQLFGPTGEEMPVAFGCGFARYRSGQLGLSSVMDGHSCMVRVGVHDKFSMAIAVNSGQPVVRDRLASAMTRAVGVSLRQFPALELQDLVGFYQGTRDTGWRVELNHDTLVLRRDPTRQGRRQVSPVQMRKNDRGQIIPIDNQLRTPMGFFREPVTGTPCLMVGTSSHKLMSSL